MKAYNPGTKKAGHGSRTWTSALERCLCRHFSSKPPQRAATKTVLGCTKQQNQADSFTLCDSAAGLWHSTLKAALQKEEWETGDTTDEMQVKIEECLGDYLITAHLHGKHMPTIKRHGQGRQHSEGLAADPVHSWRRSNSLAKYIYLQDKLGSGFAAL